MKLLCLKQFFVAIIVLMQASPCIAASIEQKLLSKSTQLIIVTTPDWAATRGYLQRFTRSSIKHPWKAEGDAVPVLIGEQGMAWDAHFQPKGDNSEPKQEGDKRTPAGIYAMGTMFGFDKDFATTKYDYFPLTYTSVCVDDSRSTHYNQLLDMSKVQGIDWSAGEYMRHVPEYKWGAVIQFNTAPVTPGNGSCVFLHIWEGENIPTAGCVAMEESNLRNILEWMDKRSHPVIVIFPKEVYEKIKTKWKLPNVA